VAVEVALELRIPSLPAPVALGTDHLDDLAPPGDQLGQALRLDVGQRPSLRPKTFGEQRDHQSIEGVGLGEATERPGEIADLPRVDDRERQLGAAERCGDGNLEAARRLENYQGRCRLAETRDQPLQAGVVTAHGEGLARRHPPDDLAKRVTAPGGAHTSWNYPGL
jgi:hypothetical protein